MILKPINIEQFSEQAQSEGLVFNSKKWLSVYGKNLCTIGIFKDDLQLIGGFYFLKTKKFGLTFLKLPPYTPHCGLFFVSDSKNTASRHNFSKEIMQELCAFLITQKSALTILAFPFNIKDLQPFIWAKFKVVPNYTYRLDLRLSIEEIKSNFDSKNRNVINKAIKDELQVGEGSMSKRQMFEFFGAALEAANANVYTAELENIFMNFSEASNSFCFEARKNGDLLGAVFCVFDQQTCYYLLAGLTKKTGVQGVNNLLVLKSIEKAKMLGCEVFDFEGSMLKGVEKFFRSFGPELVPYFTINKASLPLEMMLKFKKRELF